MAYERQTWDTGTVIPESKLLHVEDGIYNAAQTADQNKEDIEQNASDIAANKDDADSKYNELNSALATSSGSGWFYRTYPDGYIEMWYRGTFSDVGSNSYSGVSGWYYSDTLSISYPVSISNSGNAVCMGSTTGRAYVSNIGLSSSSITFRLIMMNSVESSYTVYLHLFGKT